MPYNSNLPKPNNYPKLDIARMEAFVKWYKKLQASQKTGFMIAALSLLALPTAIIMNARITENRSKATNITCKTTGCANQLCVDSKTPNIPTTCEWLPKYACTKLSTCELQPNNTCGWTETPSYTQCLKNPPKTVPKQ